MSISPRAPLAVSTPTIDIIRSHRSVRSFADRPVTDDALESMVQAGLAASSHQGLFAWSVIVVRDPGRLALLQQATGASPFIVHAPVMLVWVADMGRISRAAQERGLDATGLDYVEPLIIATTDTVMAAQNAAVAAESLGLGICYIGGLRRDIDATAEILGLPEHSYPVFGMTVGYPSEPAPTTLKPRLPVEAVMFHERYDSDAADAGVTEIERTIPAYYADQGREGTSWIGQAVDAMQAERLMNGTGNRDALARRGFNAR